MDGMRGQVLESRLALRPHEPQERGGLQGEVEAERDLVGLFRVAPGFRRPLLNDETDGVLYRKGGCDVQQVGAPLARPEADLGNISLRIA